MKILIFLLGCLIFPVNQLLAQDEITTDEYDQAVGFMYEHRHNKKVFNAFVAPHWFPDSSGVWFIHHSPDSKKYLKITFPNQLQSDLFDHHKLAQILSDSLEMDVMANDLPITDIDYKGPTELVIAAKNKRFILNTGTYLLVPSPAPNESKERESPSPDDKWIAYAEDHNLYIRSAETGEIKQLSTTGKKGYEYATRYGWGDIIEGENGDRPDHFVVSWSEDGEWISTNIWDFRSAQKMYLLDWSVDTLYRPRLLSYYRGSPGDTAMIYVKPVFFNVNTGREIAPDLPRSTHINSIGVSWSKKPGKAFLVRRSRGFQNLEIYSFDFVSENLELLYSETSKTNIDNFTHEFAEKSNLMFFLSEKSGWRQLYSLDLKTRKEKSITDGAFYVNSIERIDEEKQRIFFLASGKEESANPYHQFLYSISFNGKNLKQLTP